MAEQTSTRPSHAETVLDGHNQYPTGTFERDRHTDEELIMFLERDQLVLDTSRPVFRSPLSARANLALWALRAFVIVVTAMVVYTFVSQIVH